jgi:hypothetical protein
VIAMEIKHSKEIEDGGQRQSCWLSDHSRKYGVWLVGVAGSRLAGRKEGMGKEA